MNNNLTDQEANEIIAKLALEYLDNRMYDYRYVHYLKYKHHSFWITPTFRKFYNSYSLLGLTNEESIQIVSLDLFGFLHLNPEQTRDSTLLTKAIEDKKTLINLHKEVLSKLNPSLTTEIQKILSFKKDLNNYLMSKPLDSSLQENFKLEFKILVELISEQYKSYANIIAQMDSVLEIVSKIFNNPQSRQIYENLWFHTRTLDKSAIEYFLKVDDFTYLGGLPPLKEEFPSLIESFKKKPIFNFEKENVVLKDDVRAQISSSLKNFSNENSEYYLDLVKELTQTDLYNLINLSAIYQLVKGKQKVFVYADNISFDIDSTFLTKYPKLKELVETHLDENSMGKFTKATYELENTLKISSNPEDNQLKEIIANLRSFVMDQFFNNIDILDETFEGLSKLIEMVSNPIEILDALFINNFSALSIEGEQIIFNVEEILNSIEIANTTYLNIIEYVNSLSDADYLSMQQISNDNFRKILNGISEITKVYLDKKAFLFKLSELLQDLNVENLFIDDELLENLELNSIDIIGSKLQAIASYVFPNYTNLLKEFSLVGINEINFDTLTANLKGDNRDNQLEMFEISQEIISFLELLGIDYEAIDAEYNFKFEFKKEILTDYLEIASS